MTVKLIIYLPAVQFQDYGKNVAVTVKLSAYIITWTWSFQDDGKNVHQLDIKSLN
jgi:hypothetical protein